MRRSVRLATKVVTVTAPSRAVQARGLAARKRKAEPRSELHESSGRAASVPIEVADVADAKTSIQQDAASMSDAPWTELCSARELSVALTLGSGQVFGWKRRGEEWTGVVGRKVIQLRERDASVECRCLAPAQVPTAAMVEELKHYFRLDVSSVSLYDTWVTTDDRMASIIRSLPGLRLVRQDPVECLFSFICSSNNNIQRIQQMLDKLRSTYGDCLLASSVPEAQFHAFPEIDTLATKCQDARLRELGFGYRAPFIIKTAQQLQALGGAEYLHSLRDQGIQSQSEVQSSGPFDSGYQDQLMVFAGVGRKVADCVALFSLERLDAIPVDTHVRQIACREFDATLADSSKSLTPAVYAAVGGHFRARFAPFAGWAHSVLFAGDLSAFQAHLPAGVQKKKDARASKKSKTARKTQP